MAPTLRSIRSGGLRRNTRRRLSAGARLATAPVAGADQQARTARRPRAQGQGVARLRIGVVPGIRQCGE